MNPSAHPQHQRIDILGSQYSTLTRSQIHSSLIALAQQRKAGYVCVSNVHTTMTGFFDSTYQCITNESTFSVPDGVPLVWAMRSFGASRQDRVRGPSLMRDMMDQGRQHGFTHYLYGGSPRVLAKLKQTLEKEYPGVLIVGTESPPFRPIDEISMQDWQESAETINAAKPHFVWIGLGAPKQEIWMYRQRNTIHGMMMGIGAAFDLLAGEIPEAPAALQAIGMEWAYRLYREPRRLWRRYIFNNPAFLFLWAKQWLLQSLFSDSVDG